MGLFHVEIGQTRGEKEPITFRRIAECVTKREAMDVIRRNAPPKAAIQRVSNTTQGRERRVYRFIGKS